MRIRMFVTNVVFVETIDQFVVLTGCQGPVFQVPPPHSCLQMSLITPSVPSQLSTENL